MPSTGLPVQQRAYPNAFTEEQITEIKRLVQDSAAAAARDIAREAARAATGVLQSQAPSSSQVTPSAQAVSQDTSGGAAILGPQEQQQPLQTLQSLQPNDGSLTSTPCRQVAPFQEIPANYVKKIQSGEFFDLSKLLPKNLSLQGLEIQSGEFFDLSKLLPKNLPLQGLEIQSGEFFDLSKLLPKNLSLQGLEIQSGEFFDLSKLLPKNLSLQGLEIQSGEFFDLSKLLPKNLSLHGEEDNVSLSLENSVIKVSKKTKASTSITDIEQWTNAFKTYLSVFTDKFPLRSQELLQYLSLIRYAARAHKGLGWVIYDYKFRLKASKNKSLVLVHN